MKQLTIFCFLLLSVIGARAENVISLSSVSGHPGDEVTVEVGLTMTDAVTAAEVIIPLDKQLTYVEGSATLNTARADGHQLSAAVVNGNLRLYIYSLSLSTLKGNEGALASFKLKLKKEPADYTLTPQTMLSDVAGNSLPVSVKAGIVTLLSPKLLVVTNRIDYGHIPIRSTYAQALELQNVGNELLEVKEVAFSAAEFSVNEEKVSLQPGEKKSLTISYAPTKRGTIEETVTLTSNAINGVQKATLVSDPFSVNELHVGGTSGTSDTEVEIALRVNNMEPLVGAQCSFALPEELKYVDGSFAAASRTSSHMATSTFANGKLTLILYSTGNTAFTGDDGVIGTFKLKLDGNSGWYSLQPENVILSNAAMENMTSATEEAGVTIQSPSMNGEEQLQIGSTAVTSPVTARYTVNNHGDAALTISKVTFLAEGYEVKTSLPLTIEPRKSAELEVEYVPTVEGDYSTTMNIYTNDPTNRMKAVKVSGTVYEPNSLTLSGENQEDGTYQWTVGLNNYTDIVAVQMDIHWLDGMTTSGEALTATNRLEKHSCTVADMGNGVYRVIIYSLNNDAITGNEGTLFTLAYTPHEGTVCKDTEIQIKNIVLSDKGGSNYESGSNMSSNATFTGFKLKFVIDGETISEEFVRAGTSIILPEVPAKEGYTFCGWGEVPTTMPTHDMTFTSSYAINKYNLVYLVDSVEYKKVELEYGASITAEAVPTKEGHTFSGWSEIPATMPAKDVTVTSSFTANSYKVTYILDGETFKTETVTYGTAIPTPEVPAKEGYNFSGWGEIPATMPAQDVTVEGSFTVNSYRLVYLLDGAEYSVDSIAYGTELVQKETLAKEGYTFSGWSELPATMPAQDVTVEGSFTVNRYTIIYMVDGETYATEEIAYGEPIVLKEIPEKEGYLFSGWSEVPETMPSQDVTVTGTFTVDGIDAVVTNRLVDVYTLQGVMVKRQMDINELEDELPKGVYIVEGHKLLIK